MPPLVVLFRITQSFCFEHLYASHFGHTLEDLRCVVLTAQSASEGSSDVQAAFVPEL